MYDKSSQNRVNPVFYMQVHRYVASHFCSILKHFIPVTININGAVHHSKIYGGGQCIILIKLCTSEET